MKAITTVVRGSSSRANNLDAANKISLARLSSLPSWRNAPLALRRRCWCPGGDRRRCRPASPSPVTCQGSPHSGPMRSTAWFSDRPGSRSEPRAQAAWPAPETRSDTSSVHSRAPAMSCGRSRRCPQLSRPQARVRHLMAWAQDQLRISARYGLRQSAERSLRSLEDHHYVAHLRIDAVAATKQKCSAQ